jgi:hypothetical protein
MVSTQALKSLSECIGLPRTPIQGRFRCSAAKCALVMMQTKIERVPIHFVPMVNPVRIGQTARTRTGREDPDKVETPRLTDHLINDRSGRITRR